MDSVNFDTRLIFALLNGKVSAAINRKLGRNFHEAGIDLTPEESIVLMFLTNEEGVTQSKLCESTFKDMSSMTRLLNRMERKQLVARRVSTDDRRAHLIYLTETGRQTQLSSQHVALRTLKQALQGLGLKEIQITQGVLRRVFENATLDTLPQPAETKPAPEKRPIPRRHKDVIDL